MNKTTLPGKPLTKEETKILLTFIESSNIIINKCTTAPNNYLKKEEWKQITKKFNAMVASHPRTPQQLRLKWENLKKSARKRSTNGGDGTEYISPDEILDHVDSLLCSTGVGFTVRLGDEPEKCPVIDVEASYGDGEMDETDDNKFTMTSPKTPPTNSPRRSVFFEPTDRRKATKALQHKCSNIWCSPNISELRAMAKYLFPAISVDQNNDINEILELSEIVSQVIDLIIVTVGAKGVFTIKNVSKSQKERTLVAKHYPVKVLSKVENVSGAGDCFASGFIHGVLLGYKESLNISIGFESAKQAMFCKNTVPADLTSTTMNKANSFKTYMK